MSGFLIFCFFSFFILVLGVEDDCKPAHCRKHGPTIKFPFRIKNVHPEKCGYPGFDVSCDNKKDTVLELSSSVQFAVKSISYVDQLLNIYDPAGHCLARKLGVQHLNFSVSPFHFLQKYIITNYTLFNCSGSERIFDFGFPCHYGSDNSKYVIPSDAHMDDYQLTSCMKIGDIESVPSEIFSEDNVQLKWSEPVCGRCEAKGNRCGFKDPSTTGHHTLQIKCVHQNITHTHIIKKGVILCSVVIPLAGAALVILGIFILENRRNHLRIEKFLEDQRALKPTRFSYSDLKRITLKFTQKLGEGGYGIVYKGKLTNEINVAVKVLNNSKGDGEEFVNEVSTIGRIHHVNVVRLVGFCAQGSKRALVYEFLPNDSLEKFIFQSSGSKKMSLGWQKLRDIAQGIAKGVEYLHEGCDQQILHFDIKPHNILLDQNFNPKICDFGLAKLCSKEQSGVTMTDARGTMGYIAPEVMSRTFGRVSYKSDVYSFGMLLLEMVGGRKNTDPKANTSQIYFPQWVYSRLDLNVDEDFWAGIADGEHGNVARRLTVVGLWCIQWCPNDRPSMKEVVQMLEGDEDNLAIPPNPFPAAYDVSRMIPAVSHYQTALTLIPESEYSI